MTRKAARELVRETWDSGDPWGSCMEHRFAIARVLDVSGEGVPAAWQYVPSPADHEEWPAAEEWVAFSWAEAWERGAICAGDLLRFGEVLRRHARLCELAGRSY